MGALIYVLIFLCASKAFALTEQPIGEITSLEAAQLPVADFSLEKLDAIKDILQWNQLKNGSSQYFEPKLAILYRLHIQVPSDTSIVLRFSHGRLGDWWKGNGLRLYYLENEQIREVDPASDTGKRPAFIVESKYNGKALYLVGTSGRLGITNKLQLEFFRPDKFRNVIEQDGIYLGVCSGIVSIMIVYNLAMLAFVRKLYFFYYIVYACCILYWILDRASLVPFAPELQVCAGMLLGISALLFSFEMFGTKTQMPRLYRLSLVLISLAGLIYFAYVLGFLSGISIISMIFASLITTSLIPIVRAAWGGDKPAILLMVGWLGVLVIGVLVPLGMSTSLLPDFLRILPVGFIFETVLSSFAIAQRVHLTELKFIRENSHAFGQLKKIVYPHQLTRIKEGMQLELTMPTHPGRACVVSFDIISSSEIKHINAKKFFRDLFAKCYSAMSVGYDGYNLKARAYRIKEMGDGFLCSVGYPFESLNDNSAIEAIHLARRFADILALESEQLHLATPICCGIGIAIDTLTGFYPESGTQEYDLFGPALVLATRYEGMRKALFPGKLNNSVIIIQEVVYLSLTPAERSEFVEVDLKEMGLVVRDDAHARKLYVQVLGKSQTVNHPLSDRQSA